MNLKEAKKNLKEAEIEFKQCFVLVGFHCMNCQISVMPQKLSVFDDLNKLIENACQVHENAASQANNFCYSHEKLIINYSLGMTTDTILNPVMVGH